MAPLPDSGQLVEQLGRMLPGLAQALVPEVVAEHISRRLLPSYVQLDRLEVGKIWVHEDGSCALRYAVRITDAQGHPHELVLLGRLHRDEAAMSAYLTQVMATLADVPGAYLSRWPWRTATAQVRELALALHPFPVDPALPTLGPAVQPDAARQAGASPGEDLDVHVVHHPRTGACVLRYCPRRETDAGPAGPSAAGSAAGSAGRSAGRLPGQSIGELGADRLEADPDVLYGKVYPDGTGAVVDDFLRALGGHRGVDGLARFPTPVGYDPTLRLLLTQALPGHASVPRLLREAVAGEPTKRAALRAAVRASGRALAGLHGTDLSTAPVRPATTELLELRREIAVVARVWPGLAAAIGRHVDVLQTLVPGPAVSDLVLSHGDFTPSQVLLNGGAPALVDLDTLCWADPALDLGRYLAQLRLLGAKPAGAEAEPLLAELTDTFLAGYGEVSARSAAAATASDRIRFYAATSLTRSALHGARQLKGYRLELAMSLLARRGAGKVTP